MEPPPTAPLVRPALPGDVPTVAELTAEALAEKYRPAFGRRGRAERGIAALIASDLDEGDVSCHWVAEIGGRIAGSVHLVLGDGDERAHLEALTAAVGWWGWLRASTVLGLLGSGRVAADEAYIDELAVASWARRRGVARALLRRCEQEALARGRRRLTLWVTLDNAAARPLYDSVGFREERRRRWVAGRLVFGSPGAAFMALELPRS